MAAEDIINSALNATSWIVNRGWDLSKGAARLLGEGIHRIKHYADVAFDPVLAAGLSVAAITKLTYFPFGELPDPTTGNGRLKLAVANLGAIAACAPAVYFSTTYALKHAWRNLRRQQRFGEYPSLTNYTKTVAGAALVGALYATPLPTGDSLDDIITTNVNIFQEEGESQREEEKTTNGSNSEAIYSSKKNKNLWQIKHATYKPIEGIITSHYGQRGNDFHEGVDISCEKGSAVQALHSGKITAVKHNDGASGNWVGLELQDNGQTYTYTHAHMNSTTVKKGQKVQAGQKLGTCGNTGHSTGPHLHLRLKKGTLKETDQNPLKRAY